MSLINDALKRAQQQAPPPPVPGLPLRPAESAATRAPSFTWMIPVVAALLAFAVLFLAWRTLATRPNRTEAEPQNSDLVAQAKSLDPTMTTANNQPAPTPEPVMPVVKSGPVPEPSPSPVGEVMASTAPATLPTNPPAAVAPPEPPPLRLQAIVYSLTRPSAMISGKSLFVGDRVGDWQVTAITRETATLVNHGQTRVLALPE